MSKLQSHVELPPRHVLALREFLRNGGNLSLTAKVVGVSRQSIKKWTMKSAWKSALAQVNSEILPRRKVRPRKLFQVALLQLEDDLQNGNAETKSKAAHAIFSKLASALIVEDAEKRIRDLAERLHSLENAKNTNTQTNTTTNLDFEFDEEN